MLRRRAMSYELVFKALEFQAILKRGGGGGGRGARKSVNRKLPRMFSTYSQYLQHSGLSMVLDVSNWKEMQYLGRGFTMSDLSAIDDPCSGNFG